VRLGPAQVDIAVTQACFFRGIGSVFDSERRCFGVVQDVQFRGDELDFTAGQLGIGFFTLDDITLDADDELAAHVFGFGVSFGLRLFVEDDLNDSGAVAHVKEKQITKVAAARNPAKNDSRLVSVGGAQRSAVVCAFQVAEKVQHVVIPFREKQAVLCQAGQSIANLAAATSSLR